MIGSSARPPESPSKFPSGILLTQKEFEHQKTTNDFNNEGIKRVILDGAEHYCILPEMKATPKRQRIASVARNRIVSTPEQRQLATLSRRLQDERDRLRKLKMLEKSRVENADLDEVISKWRKVIQEVLIELKKRTSLRSSDILRSIGIPYKHLDLELSSCESDSEEDR